jgi:Na+-transporting NADH:ubiquinone oxidoreductase subunit A
LNLPIAGSIENEENISEYFPKHVALLGNDFVGMKPTMLVKEGEEVKVGQKLFQDKKNESVFFTAPVAGKITEINRGHRRAFQSVVIEQSAKSFEDLSNQPALDFPSFKTVDNFADLESEYVKNLLIESGLWTHIRTRPYSKVANPNEEAHSIFINAMETHPLSQNSNRVVAQNLSDFHHGCQVISKLLSKGKTYLCHDGGLNTRDLDFSFLEMKHFSGPHPAGLSGTHIHKVDPVGMKKHVWYINYQAVTEIGKLFSSGKIDPVISISVAGPMCRKPSVYKTIRGAKISPLIDDLKFTNEEVRVISGSVFGGRKVSGAEDYLGQFHQQVSLIKESTEREFLGWHSPGFNKFSLKSIYVSKLFPKKKFWFDSNMNGSHRSIVPIGSFEKVFPFDTEPAYLCRSIMSGNTELGYQLGALELDEEDVSLLTYADNCKNDYGTNLRKLLTAIEKEG